MKEDFGVASVRERGERRKKWWVVGKEGGGGPVWRWAADVQGAREDKVDAGWLRGWKKDEGRRRERSRSSRTDWRRRWKEKKSTSRPVDETRRGCGRWTRRIIARLSEAIDGGRANRSVHYGEVHRRDL